MSGLEESALVGAEVEGILELGGLARPLDAEKRQRGVGGDHRALVGAEQIARILRRENERALVLPDASGEADHEAPNRRVFEEQTELVDHQQAAPVLTFDPSPQRLGQEEVHRRDHLVAQLAHAENDDRRLQVDVGRRAEHLAQAAVDPAMQDDRDT